jgi:protein TonB
VKRATIIVSAVIHAGVAVSLMGAAQRGEKHKAISVAVSDAKKKEKPKPPPPPPPPPRRAPRVVASVPKAAPVEAPPPKAAPAKAVETALALSNDDAPGGIALAPAGAAAAAAAPARVASAVSSSRTRRAREALGAGPNLGESGGGGSFDEPCNEEPTKPVAVYRVDLEYTAAARTEGIEGKIKLKVTIAADGSVSDVEVLSSVEPALDAVAVAAARQWRFKPAMACGKPVAGGTFIMSKTYELTD